MKIFRRDRVRRIYSTWLALATVTILFGCTTHGAGAGSCGPFGDPPAKIISSPEPYCWSGTKMASWNDSDGTPRYSCVYEPTTATPQHKLPMLVYIHPSLLSADSVKLTNLLGSLYNAKLSDSPSREGFILLAPEGRKTSHFYPWPDDTGYGWDNWYRQFNPSGDVKIGSTVYKENVDAAALDHFIAEEVATGKVDTNRIYLTGWSNGAAMAVIYGLSRPNIAAIAVYSSPDPFGALGDPCQQVPVTAAPKSDGEIEVFNPRLAVMHIYNSCDTGGLCANISERLNKQLRAIGVNPDNVVLDALRNQVSSCDASCGTDPNGDYSITGNPKASTLGFMNHARWPSSWLPQMLEFLRGNRLIPPQQIGSLN
jgi:hypothetical protein